jgi:sugar lactone lactonase YvrE
MVNLHRWLKRTSPHLLIAGSLAITGLSGCRSTQYTAVEVEPAPVESTYPAPLIVPEALPETLPEAVTKAVPYTEPVAAPPESVTSESATVKSNGDLDLKPPAPPPAPPLADSGSNSGTGTAPDLPLPEIDAPKELPVEKLTKVKPRPKAVAKETKSNVANVDPLDESNLFPEDNPKPAKEPAIVAKDSVGVVKDADAAAGKGPESKSDKQIADPVTDSFEPVVANPEVPVPNPGKSTVSVKEPESELTPVEPVQKKVTEEKEKPEKETSSLFPPPKVELPQPKIKSGGSAKQDDKEGKLPVTSPKVDVDPSKPAPDKGVSAALPVITPAIVAEKPKPSPGPSRPNIDVKKPTEPKQTTSIDLPMPEQLASIAKPDRKLPTTNTLNSNPFSRPLFPKSPPKPKAPQDAISVVAEVWSPAENIAFDNSGNAFVSHGKHISKVAPDGNVEPWATMGSPRGHVVLPDGSHLVADAGQRAIVKLNEAGKQVRKVATRSDGDFLRAPNDLVVDSKGGVYFTDPGYARIRNPIGRIHYVAADGSVKVVVKSLAFPEGIALSADGSKLLVVESQNRQVVEFEIRSPGQVGRKLVFAELPARADDTEGFANGLLVDPQSGHVFVAHGDRQQVEMLSAEGKLLRSFDMGAAVNGIAFKQGDFSRVFATGGARSGKKEAGQLFEIRIAE